MNELKQLFCLLPSSFSVFQSTNIPSHAIDPPIHLTFVSDGQKQYTCLLVADIDLETRRKGGKRAGSINLKYNKLPITLTRSNSSNFVGY